MDAKVREEILKAEDKFRQAVREEVIISKSYDIGLQYDLSMAQMSLLAFPYLMDEIKRLRIMAGVYSEKDSYAKKFLLGEWPVKEDNPDYKILTGGRGGGKTEALSEDMKRLGYK